MIRSSVARLVTIVAWIATLVACTTDPTQVLIVVDTDLPRTESITLRVTVRRGTDPISQTAAPDRIWLHAPADVPPTDGGRADASSDSGGDGAVSPGTLVLPLSFLVLPPANAPRDAFVTVRVEAETRDRLIRRDLRFRFRPRNAIALRVFLQSCCAATDYLCAGTPCARGRYCEEFDRTCGDEGTCVPVLVEPVPQGDLARGMDGGPSGSLTGPWRAAVCRAAECGDGVCNGSETACTCARDACRPRCGDGCCNGDETRVSCAADCGSACGDGTCMPPMETSVGCCRDCGASCGDGACNCGENSMTCCADCGAVCGDMVCNCGESTRSCCDCGPSCGDGVCNCGETTAGCAQDCGTRCGDGACNGAENPCNCETDCNGALCPCRVRCCNGEEFVRTGLDDTACRNIRDLCTAPPVDRGFSWRIWRDSGRCIYNRDVPCGSPTSSTSAIPAPCPAPCAPGNCPRP